MRLHIQHPLVRVLIIAAVTGLGAPIGRSIPVHILDLDKLTRDSDLIVVGEVAAIQEVGRTSAVIGSQDVPVRVENAQVRIDRVLKATVSIGTPSELIELRLYVPDKFVGWPSTRLHFYATYFLKSDASGIIGFTDPAYPFAPALPQTHLNGSTPIDRVVNEIANFLYVPEVALNDRMAALTYLGHSRSESATSMLRSALKSDSQQLRYISADKLLERNDISGLPVAKTALLRADAGTSDNLVENMSNAIGIGLKDPNAIEDLTELLRARSTSVRRNAALALARTQAQRAVTPLLYALNDSDREVSYYAAIGLAEIAGQLDWRPSMEEFDADPIKYLKHWSEWQRAGKTQSQPSPN